jgi:uncharacterized protein
MNRDPIPFRIPVRRANSWFERLRGLLWAPPPPPGHGLLLVRCWAIHTFGMRHPIDVAFVDGDGIVLALRRGLGPARVAYCTSARSTLEMRAGEIARLGLWRGSRIEFVEQGGER